MMLLCKACKQMAEHRMRSDRPTKPRSACVDCTRRYLHRYRLEHWQRRKLRDTWRGMIGRCTDRKRDRWINAKRGVPLYRDYGARGIKVCRRWLGPTGFANFVADMGPPPSPAHTLDRLDNDAGYVCGRCEDCIMRVLDGRANKRAHNFVDMTGTRVGRLTVVAYAGRRGTAAAWRCLCECGKETVVTRNALRDALQGMKHGTRSCGCSRGSPGKGSRPNRRRVLPPGAALRNDVLRGYRREAERRGHAWALTDVEFDSLLQQPCFYCTAPPSNARTTNGVHVAETYTYNGIDRKDNEQGYTTDNCVSCCAVCNHAKHTMAFDAFLDWVLRVAANVQSMTRNVRWATPEEQRANRCNTVWVTAPDPVTGQEVRRSLADWSRATGVNRHTLQKRLRAGWAPALAVVPAQPVGVPF